MSDLAIRNAIRQYIAGEVGARSLEDYLEALAWEGVGDPARRLADEALRLLAEEMNGDWTESELREQLGILTRTYWFEQASRRTRTGTGSTVIRQPAAGAAAERLRVAESV